MPILGSLSLKQPKRDSATILPDALGQLSRAEDLTSITKIVAHSARELVNAQGATFILRLDDQCFYAEEDAISPLWKGRLFPAMACISGWSMIHREVVVTPDIHLDSRIPQDAYRPTFVKSLCMVPIRASDPIGAIGTYWSEVHTPTEKQIQFIQTLANSTAVALENIELRSALNRRALEKERLLSKNQELELAMYSLAHDLRNPITAILSVAQLLESFFLNDSRQSLNNLVRLLSKTSHHLSTQVEKMLALYRLKTQSLNTSTVNVTTLAREVIDEIRFSNRDRTIQIQIDEGLEVSGDSDLIRIVLGNLLSNAIQFSKKKPLTEIVVGKLQTAPTEKGFFVQDNGIGFTSTEALKLFQPSVRLHPGSEFSGHGIGLASVARIIRFHNGKIWATGDPDKGAIFYITIPEPASKRALL